MKQSAAILKQIFGEVYDKPAYLFTLRNTNGNEISITNYGGIIQSWLTRDRIGNRSNIVAGLSSLKLYEKNDPYFGAIIGRYCNRISNASFMLDGNVYKLSANNGHNHLHGGRSGFDKKLWYYYIPDKKQARLQLRYISKNGEEGFPGSLYIIVEYIFTNADELVIQYHAKTDAPTPVNFTNHSYFNLSGDFSSDIGQQLLSINADKYVSVHHDMIPDGRLPGVADTAFDFRIARSIHSGFIDRETGFDHNYVLNKGSKLLSRAATVNDPESGRQLDVFTTEPGLQFYTANHLDGSFVNERGQSLKKGCAFCLETQHFPDSPNRYHFPSCILRPGENFYSETIYRVRIT